MTIQNQLFYHDSTRNIEVYIKREDLIHPIVSGNKFRKLKYNLAQASIENQETLLTFGGAFSNHIAAVAHAGKTNNFKTIGIIRGEELANEIAENPTLKFAKECGMQFEFVSREDYRRKGEPYYAENWQKKYGNFYLIPEGGTNTLAIKGCEEILSEADKQYDFICCAVGTGGTISGIINTAEPSQKILGFPALKGSFLKEDIRKFVNKNNWELIEAYHFGGYGKVTDELVQFMNQNFSRNGILLDPIYTGKMAFGVLDLIALDYFNNNTKILMIHSGGIQGIAGMNLKLAKKNLPLIHKYD